MPLLKSYYYEYYLLFKTSQPHSLNYLNYKFAIERVARNVMVVSTFSSTTSFVFISVAWKIFYNLLKSMITWYFHKWGCVQNSSHNFPQRPLVSVGKRRRAATWICKSSDKCKIRNGNMLGSLEKDAATNYICEVITNILCTNTSRCLFCFCNYFIITLA